MQSSCLLAATAALALLMQTPLALAQGAPAAGGTAAPAATTAAPAATTTAPGATNDASSQPTDPKKSASKKPAKKKMTRQQEIDHSVDSGTVPARYRSSVPKQYQQYVPFDKR
ncbi:outer membrane receptor protein involved in Fe transport [Bradyrhizobium sp. LM6.10]